MSRAKQVQEKARMKKETDKVRLRGVNKDKIMGKDKMKDMEKVKRVVKMTRRWPKVTGAPLHRRLVYKNTMGTSGSASKDKKERRDKGRKDKVKSKVRERGKESAESGIDDQKGTISNRVSDNVDKSPSQKEIAGSSVTDEKVLDKNNNDPAPDSTVMSSPIPMPVPKLTKRSRRDDDAYPVGPAPNQEKLSVLQCQEKRKREGSYSRTYPGGFFFSAKTSTSPSGTAMEDQVQGYHVKDSVFDVKWCNYCSYTSYVRSTMKTHLHKHHPQHYLNETSSPKQNSSQTDMRKSDFHGFRTDDDSQGSKGVRMSLLQCLDMLTDPNLTPDPPRTSTSVSTQTLASDYLEKVMVTTAEGEFVLIPMYVLKEAPRLHLELCPEPNMDFLIGKAGQLVLEEEKTTNPVTAVADAVPDANGETSRVETYTDAINNVASNMDTSTSEVTNNTDLTTKTRDIQAAAVPQAANVPQATTVPPPVYADAVSHTSSSLRGILSDMTDKSRKRKKNVDFESHVKICTFDGDLKVTTPFDMDIQKFKH